MGQEKQLAIPTAAAKDAQSFELIRVWIAQQSQQITLRAGVWQEPAAWGVMLADLARNIVQIHTEADEEVDAEAFLAGLLEGFDNEIEAVLDEFGGGEEEAG
jgi:hypothetical protein